MATFKEIQDRVALRVIDTPQAVQQEIPLLINEAMEELMVDHNFKIMETIKEFVTVVNTRSLGVLPTDWKEANGFPFYRDQYDRAKMMTLGINVQGPSVVWSPDDVGSPALIRENETTTDDGSTGFDVWPLPDGLSDWDDGEYRVMVPYFRYLPELSAPGDTNWFTLNGADYLTKAATAAAFALDWDEQREAVWTQKATIAKQKLLQRDKKQRLQAVGTLVPHWEGARTPQIRW